MVALLAQGGWAGQLVGIDTATPVPPFIPVIMFATLFGLSMDYEVFLLSRVREAWLRGRDTSGAVTEGLTRTAGVISAAAAIMVVVFGALALSPEVFLKLIGHRPGDRGARRRDDRPARARPRRDADARRAQLVDAALAGPDRPAHRAGAAA